MPKPAEDTTSQTSEATALFSVPGLPVNLIRGEEVVAADGKSYTFLGYATGPQIQVQLPDTNFIIPVSAAASLINALADASRTPATEQGANDAEIIGIGQRPVMPRTVPELRYAHATRTPGAMWYDVVDAVTGEKIRDIVEANADEAWIVQNHRDGDTVRPVRISRQIRIVRSPAAPAAR